MATPQATPKPRPVKQDEIQQVLTYRLEVESIKHQLKTAEEELLKAELLLMDRLKKQSPIQPGELNASIDTIPGRRVPKWKEEFARVAGPAAVDQVIASTPQSAPSDKLVISRKGAIER